MEANATIKQGSEFRVRIVRSREELPLLAARWRELALLGCDHDAPFFQSFEWIEHVARIRGDKPLSHYRQYLATVWRGDALVCIWPLMLVREHGAWIARSFDDPFGQFGGLVLDDPANASACVAVILQELRSAADGLHIEAVVAGSALHEALLRAGARYTASQQSVVVDLRPYATVKDFAQTVNAKTRKNIRNLTNRLRRAHPAEHVVMFDGAAIEPVVAETYDARVEWLHRNGRSSAAFRDDDFRRIATTVARSDVALIAFALKAGDVTIASQWGFLYDRRYYAYMSATNPAFAEFSAGRLHLGMVIEVCFEHGLKVIELMPPPADYKLAWSEQVKEVQTLALAFGLRGRIALGLTNEIVPRLRRLSRALPESFRVRLVRAFNKG